PFGGTETPLTLLIYEKCTRIPEEHPGSARTLLVDRTFPGVDLHSSLCFGGDWCPLYAFPFSRKRRGPMPGTVLPSRSKGDGPALFRSFLRPGSHDAHAVRLQ